MKQTDGHGNGTNQTLPKSFTTLTIEDNPYLITNEGGREERETSTDVAIENEDGPPTEPEDERRNAKHRRRRLTALGIAASLLLGILIAAVLYRRSPTRIDYGRAKRSGVMPPTPNANSSSGRDYRTEKAIEEAQRIAVGEATSSSTATSEKRLTEADPNSKRVLDNPFRVPTPYSDTIPTPAGVTDSKGINASASNVETGSEGTSPTRAADNHSNAVHSQRNSESSLYMNEVVSEQPRSPSANANGSAVRTKPFETKLAPIKLPAFGTMLPVRTIGALYTLRTGALVRLELTREIKGNGWSMKRGTTLVGTSKGSDLDRAYVNLVGFIDPQSGRLVKLGGDLLGGDGAAGLKGKRRQIDGGWLRALTGLSNAAIDMAGAVFSGRGRDTVIISDGIRTKTINPVADEISGMLGSEFNRKHDKSFVEVTAGTPGYVMVTDLPTSIKGTDATPELNSDSLTSLTDAAATQLGTGLSDGELAQLLSNGSPEQIKAAMPRMSPGMRMIAEGVLRP